MAKAGVTKGKRMLILPWLIVFMGIKILLILCFITDVFYNPFNVTQIFLLLLMMCVMSAWRHMQVAAFSLMMMIIMMMMMMMLMMMMMMMMMIMMMMQVVFIVMGLPRPEVIGDSEASPQVARSEAKNDFPPKYEDVTEAEKPPRYDENDYYDDDDDDNGDQV